MRRPPEHVSRLVLITAVVCGGFVSMPYAAQQTGDDPRCGLPPSAVLRTEGNARLEMWEFPAADVWFTESLPESADYAGYRTAIRAAGADLVRSIADPPQPKDDAEREMWRREAFNEELMYSGGGRVRRIHCLEAALFARQHARYSELAQPTEFVAQVLRRGDRLKVYMGASDQEFPPKSVYGLTEVAVDVAAGWQYFVVLHNHTIRTLKGRTALGVTAPSTSDVELFSGLVPQLGLREVWVTNGMYTGVVSAEGLVRFVAR
jgi:hypothetical protein